MPLFLVALAPFILRTLFVYVGMGIITFIGYQIAVNGLLLAIENRYDNLGTDILAYLALAGVKDALGYILAALSIRLGALLTPKFAISAFQGSS